MKFLSILLFLLFQAPAASPTIVQINLDDIVHPISADYIKDGLNHAKDINARAVLLRIDTPGASSTPCVMSWRLFSPLRFR